MACYRYFLLVFVAVSAFAAPVHAQFMDMRGTPEDQRACRTDAVRLCKPLLARNDSMVVLQCFLANQKKLTKSCRGVLIKYGQLPP
jgi:hypothetical protein